MKNNKRLIIRLVFIFVLILVSTVLISKLNEADKYNYDNLKVIKYYSGVNKKSIKLTDKEKKKLSSILNRESFKQLKNTTSCMGILKYKITFDKYSLNISDSCDKGYISEDNKNYKSVLLSNKLLKFIKKY